MKSFGGRYADDFGGNHIDRIRQQHAGGMYLDYTHKICAACKTREQTKGGSFVGKRWICEECKGKK